LYLVLYPGERTSGDSPHGESKFVLLAALAANIGIAVANSPTPA
jgi:hypothetical protein